MNSLFGDATSVMPTPETLAEAESLFSGNRSPVPELDLGASGSNKHGPDSAIPGLDIDPPTNISASAQAKGSATLPRPNMGRSVSGRSGEGVGGWISNMIARTKGQGGSSGESGQYKRVGQNED